MELKLHMITTGHSLKHDAWCSRNKETFQHLWEATKHSQCLRSMWMFSLEHHINLQQKCKPSFQVHGKDTVTNVTSSNPIWMVETKHCVLGTHFYRFLCILWTEQQLLNASVFSTRKGTPRIIRIYGPESKQADQCSDQCSVHSLVSL